ncbi:MAG: hypothetical protein GTO41_27880, partial [Burkholderiales bacterium]|nr:hypothetical protein [Burkholderiales bacterium]
MRIKMSLMVTIVGVLAVALVACQPAAEPTEAPPAEEVVAPTEEVEATGEPAPAEEVVETEEPAPAPEAGSFLERA